VTIGIFEAIKTTRQTLIVNLNNLLDYFGLRKKIITFVKDEGVNLNVMTSTPRFIMSCDILRLEKSFNGSCFRDIFSKACQYGIIEEKVYKDMGFMQLSDAPPSSLMDPTISPKVKTMEGERVRACFLAHTFGGRGAS
jgi:hypothetical protein